MAERHHRALPHDEGLAEGKIQRLGVHRDTWSSNVYAQTNWWAPIYPATAGRTIVFYPTCLTRPIENTSASWDLEELRAGRHDEGMPAIPLVPEPVEPVDPASESRVVIEPCDLLCFSGVYLHAGAPNVDGPALRTALEWFHRVDDGTAATGDSSEHAGADFA